MSRSLLKAAHFSAAIALLWTAGHAAAETAYDLRALNVSSGFTILDNQRVNATASYVDRFSNGDPLTGGQYTGVFAPDQLYQLRNNGFSAGSEAPVNDYFGQTYGVGRLRFGVGDAIATPSTLDAPGTMNMVNRITLRDPGILTSDTSFSANAAFNFATPDAGSSYGLRVTENLMSGAAFDDQLDLRVVRNGQGQAALNLRRLTSTGGLDLSATGYGTVNFTNFLNAGKTLADIAVVGLEFVYVPGPGNGVRADVELVDSNGQTIGSYDFFNASNGAIYPQIFHGEGFTHVAAGANWTVSTVPEPGTYALMLGGLTVLAWAARRRTRA